MALINCPDCSSSVSDQAASCVKCGRPIRRDTQKLKIKGYCHQLENLGFNTVLPLIKLGMVLVTACLMGIMGKLISLSITVPDLLDRYSVADIGKNVIAESGLYVVYAFIALLVVIKNRWMPWLNAILDTYEIGQLNKIDKEKLFSHIHVFVATVLAPSTMVFFINEAYSIAFCTTICLLVVLASYSNRWGYSRNA